jgi:hypothetical protein
VEPNRAVATIDPQAEQALVIMPVLNFQQFLQRREVMYSMLNQVMLKDTDYGTIPGTPKPTLYKAGAEKLAQLFGLSVDLVPVEIREEWADRTHEAFLYYKYQAVVYRGSLKVIAYTGIAHSHEVKYRWRWVPEHEVPSYLDKAGLERKEGHISEFRFAIDKAETSGKYAKPAEYWQQFKDAIRENRAKFFKKQMGKTTPPNMKEAVEIDCTVFRVPNPEVEDLAHTLNAMSQKRALVGAIRYATNASDIFEVNDAVEEGDLVIDGQYSEVTAQEKDRQDKWEERGRNGNLKGQAVTPEQAAQDTADLYGDKKTPERPPVKIDAKSEVYRRFGSATKADKDRPPADDGKALEERCAALNIAHLTLTQRLFSKNLTALSAAQVTAIMDATDDDLRAIVTGDGSGK